MADPCYPFMEMMKDIFCKKSRAMEDLGYFKTMSGDWYDGHGNFVKACDVNGTIKSSRKI